MATLLLRLAGPLQSWGTDSKFETRRTNAEPSKSGVIGMIAAAFGRRRDEPMEDLSALRFGVRVDQPGVLMRDFQTAKNDSDSWLTYRYYLADAVFLVGLEGELSFLEKIEDALRHPAFPLFLGKRSCPPTQPLIVGLRQTSLEEALQHEAWQMSEWRQKKEVERQTKRGARDSKLRLLLDVEKGEVTYIMRRDVPVSFSPRKREYAERMLTETSVALPATKGDLLEHDPMAEL